MPHLINEAVRTLTRCQRRNRPRQTQDTPTGSTRSLSITFPVWRSPENLIPATSFFWAALASQRRVSSVAPSA